MEKRKLIWKHRRKPGVEVYAEIDICWETEEKETGKQGVAYISRHLSEPEDVIQIFLRKIKGKYVNRWVWSTRKYKTCYVEKVLGKVLEHFSGKRDVLQTIKRDLDASITLEIVIEMNKRQVPALVINEEVVEFVNAIEGCIDVDMYIA